LRNAEPRIETRRRRRKMEYASVKNSYRLWVDGSIVPPLEIPLLLHVVRLQPPAALIRVY